MERRDNEVVRTFGRDLTNVEKKDYVSRRMTRSVTNQLKIENTHNWENNSTLMEIEEEQGPIKQNLNSQPLLPISTKFIQTVQNINSFLPSQNCCQPQLPDQLPLQYNNTIQFLGLQSFLSIKEEEEGGQQEQQEKEDQELEEQKRKREQIEHTLVRPMDRSLGIERVYIDNITTYLHSIQVNYQINPNYMNNQQDLQEKMRVILIDWLVDVCVNFQFYSETLFLTVFIIDKYLSNVPLDRSQLQLLGTAALLIASKFNEIFCPLLTDLVRLTENTYDSLQIQAMEASILEHFKFQFNAPSPLYFLSRYIRCLSNLTNKQHALCLYVLELTLLNISTRQYSNSLQAASVIFLTNKLFSIQPWSDLLVEITTFQQEQLKDCARDFCIILQNAVNNAQINANNSVDYQQFTAIKRKYAHHNYLSISNLKLEKVNHNSNQNQGQ